MAEKLIVDKSKVIALADSIRAKTKSTSLLSFDNMKTAVDELELGGGVIEVDELPEVVWSGTAVPNTGYVEKVYFNNNLSDDEIENILKDLSLSGGGSFNGNPFMYYYVLQSLRQESTSDGVSIEIHKFENGAYSISLRHYDSSVLLWCNNKYLSSIDETAMYFKKEYINIYSNVIDYEGSTPVGFENEYISQLFSLTSFEQPLKENSLIKLTNKGTSIPNNSTVETIYFNTDISTDDFYSIVNNINFIDASVLGLSGFSFYPVMAYLSGSNPYILTFFKQSDSVITLELVNFSTNETVQSFFKTKYINFFGSGWYTFSNPYPIGYDVLSTVSGVPIGTQNELLKDLISTTPFETLYLVDKGTFKELIIKE